MSISSTPPASLPSAQPVEPQEEPPFLRFYHSPELRAKTLAVLTKVEQAPDPTRLRGALADLVMELTDSGLHYYFLRALDLTKSGFVVKQSASLGIGSVMRIMGPVVHNIMGMMDRRQLLIICSHIRDLMT